MYANVDTLSKVKKCEIEELIKQESPDLICICEIFPKKHSSKSPKNNTTLMDTIYI